MLALALPASTAAGGPAVPGPALWAVEPADDWTALFDRTSGWTGADGIYSIPLAGADTPGSADGNRTLWVFGDTFVGEVNPDGERQPGTVLVNNTLAMSAGAIPDPAAIAFHVATDGSGEPRAVFLPATPLSEPGDWYWVKDGIAIGPQVHFFANRLRRGVAGLIDGVSLLTLSMGSPRRFASQRQVDTPLLHRPTDGRGTIVLGGAILANTEAAGAPQPDGHLYIYGHQDEPYNNQLVAARVPEDGIADFDRYQYWDGSGWTAEIDRIAPLVDFISSEFSVSPLADGTFVLVYQFFGVGKTVAVRIGASPVGPFGEMVEIYTCPEPDHHDGLLTYGAKAHPHLSRPGEVLISYNVTTTKGLAEQFRYADIYRPRFIRARIGAQP